MTDRRIEIKPEDVQVGDWVELEGWDSTGVHRLGPVRARAIDGKTIFIPAQFGPSIPRISRRNIVRAWREAPERRVAQVELAPGRPCKVYGYAHLVAGRFDGKDFQVYNCVHGGIQVWDGHNIYTFDRRNVDLIERRRKDGGAR